MYNESLSIYKKISYSITSKFTKEAVDVIPQDSPALAIFMYP